MCDVLPECRSRFALGLASSDERRAVLKHLLRGCDTCAAALRQILSPPAQPPDAYEAVLSRDLLSAAAQAEALLDELLAMPSGKALLAAQRRRFANGGVIEAALRRATEQQFSDPRMTLRLAQIATALAVTATSGARPRDLVARCRGLLGNAYRLCGDFEAADAALDAAVAHEPMLAASIHSYRASLRFDQRRFVEAIEEIDHSIGLLRNVADAKRLGRALIQRAMILGESGKPEAAVWGLKEAAALIDAEAEPRLALICGHNLVRFFSEIGPAAQALALFVELRPLYEQHGDKLIRAKALWLEGQIMIRAAHFEAASPLLTAARQSFVDQGQPYEAALVTIELAEVLVRSGLTREARRLLRQARPILKQARVGRESIVAVLLDRAAEQIDQCAAAVVLLGEARQRLRETTPHRH